MMSVLQTELRTLPRVRTYSRFAVSLLVLCFSLYYFVDVVIRAGEKYFWFDEIVTQNVCRFGTLSAMWNALKHGVDFNPLLFFWITNLATKIFGNNLIGPRVPEMIAFWTMCLCLFRFVHRRSGLVAATVVMLVPTISGGFYYAYEARPHGLVLGFCGLALVFWQMTFEQPERRRWWIGFSLSIFAACLMHCYGLLIALPFGLVELVNTVRFRHIRWRMWIALVTPVVIACLTYVPLLLEYRRITRGTDWSQSYMTNLGHLVAFYGFLLSPCILFVIWSFAALAAETTLGARSPARERINIRSSEVLLGAAFLVLPFFGFILAKVVVHGLFEDRYFVTSLIGFCVLLGLAMGARGPLNWMPITLAVLLAFPIGWQFSALLWHRHKGVAEKTIEPSSGFSMNMSLNGPLGRYRDLLPSDSEPIGTLRFSDFLYLLYYGGSDIRSRLYYIKPNEHDFFEAGFENFHPWAAYRFNDGLTPAQFVHLSPRSTIIGDYDKWNEIPGIVKAGGIITAMQVLHEDHHFVINLASK